MKRYNVEVYVVTPMVKFIGQPDPCPPFTHYEYGMAEDTMGEWVKYADVVKDMNEVI